MIIQSQINQVPAEEQVEHWLNHLITKSFMEGISREIKKMMDRLSRIEPTTENIGKIGKLQGNLNSLIKVHSLAIFENLDEVQDESREDKNNPMGKS